MLSKTLAWAAATLPLLHHALAANTTACNNSPSLCSRSYGNITHLGAHDSPFLRDSSTSYSSSGNQYYNSTVQLDAGVRLLSAQVHEYNNSGTVEWHLCHSSCNLLDAGTLSSWLSDIKTWLDANTNDVVTLVLVNSDDATADEIKSEFSTSGIDSYAYEPANTTGGIADWPTLESLISNNTRLVTFVASLDESSDYLLNEFDFVFENDYDNTSPSNYSCDPQRPTAVANDPEAALQDDLLFLMNHFLYEQQSFGIEQPNATYANTTNGATGFGSLGVAASNCASVYSKAPWAVLVDFFNMGPAIDVVDELNGVSDVTGRTSVSSAAVTATSAAGKIGRGSLHVTTGPIRVPSTF
ncbi:hypothetical protein K490DRAFT_57135 [Saccharata proteae CBS 121410]|uniref:PLC-like phosphodiesterase n=1 Tax=Saccharata proteae CBS 121410 TaxID=1314787 RepID=A0A9P4LWH6_9PEZI|nr:hypothetical protein K490DRAFT_57135 [Saccharata proteae CBS 121410]